MYEEIPLTFGILNSRSWMLPFSSSESFLIAATVFDTASVLLSALISLEVFIPKDHFGRLCASVGLPGGWFCSTSHSRTAGEISRASKTFGMVVVAFLELIGIFLKLKTSSPFKMFSMVFDLLSVIGSMMIAILQWDSSAAVIGRVQIDSGLEMSGRSFCRKNGL
ncbi:hypothetical protein K439DRAFT_1618453 [Ramaria rubella]|nr:hypothetical protein K439DRAFT_1618453 [Ramaria rubella]